MRLSTAAVAIVGAAVILAATASASTGRYCGEAPRMISNSVYATHNVGCREARHLIKATLGGSWACYHGHYLARVNCYVDGYHCRSRYHPEYGTSTGRCVRGRRIVTGYAGP
ncbi:MAG: hypothetical protein ACTHQQ_14310 [Solirubrobacteraceae bacterium]